MPAQVATPFDPNEPAICDCGWVGLRGDANVVSVATNTVSCPLCGATVLRWVEQQARWWAGGNAVNEPL